MQNIRLMRMVINRIGAENLDVIAPGGAKQKASGSPNVMLFIQRGACYCNPFNKSEMARNYHLWVVL